VDDEIDASRGPQTEDQSGQGVDEQQRVGHGPGKRDRAAVVGDADDVEGPEDDGDEQDDGRQCRLDVLEARQRSGGRPRRSLDEDGEPADRNHEQTHAEREERRLA